MIAEHPFIKTVREAARKRILFLRHALDRMNSPERMITRAQVRQVVFHGDLIEDYPDDVGATVVCSWVLGKLIGPYTSFAHPKEITWLSSRSIYQIQPGGNLISGNVRSKKAMECCSCHGTMTKGTTTYTVNRKGYHFIIHDVPAWVCQQCGEALFEEETVDAVQQLIRTMDVGVTRLVTQPA